MYEENLERKKQTKIDNLSRYWLDMKNFHILSFYTRCDRLSQKTISHCCPFKGLVEIVFLCIASCNNRSIYHPVFNCCQLQSRRIFQSLTWHYTA
jgi:hypothetical protein